MLLAIDTSAGVSVAAGPAAAPPTAGSGSGGGPVVERDEPATDRHAEVLTGLIRAVLGELGAGIGDLTRIAAGTGPAPFTGLRVGLITARALAEALAIPVVGVCSLDVLAAQVAAQPWPGGPDGGSGCPREFRVAANARRREVYWAGYRIGPDGGAQRMSEPSVDVPALLTGGPPVFGPATAIYPAELTAGTGPAGPAAVSAAALLAGVATGRLATTGTEPLYLRRPDATLPAAAPAAVSR